MARPHTLTQDVEPLCVLTAVQCLPPQNPVPRHDAPKPPKYSSQTKKESIHKEPKLKRYCLEARKRHKGYTCHYNFQYTRSRNYRGHSHSLPKRTKSTGKKRSITGSRKTSNRANQNPKSPGTLLHYLPEYDAD